MTTCAWDQHGLNSASCCWFASLSNSQTHLLNHPEFIYDYDRLILNILVLHSFQSQSLASNYTLSPSFKSNCYNTPGYTSINSHVVLHSPISTSSYGAKLSHTKKKKKFSLERGSAADWVCGGLFKTQPMCGMQTHYTFIYWMSTKNMWTKACRVRARSTVEAELVQIWSKDHAMSCRLPGNHFVMNMNGSENQNRICTSCPSIPRVIHSTRNGGRRFRVLRATSAWLGNLHIIYNIEYPRMAWTFSE